MRLKKLWITIIIVLIIDQATKIILTNKHYSVFGITIINYTENTGATFSILQGYLWLFIAVAIAALIVLFHYSRKIKQEEKMLQVLTGMLIGGMIGNLIDRIFLGHVRDFIDLKMWAVFNVADTAVFISIVSLLICFIRESLNKKKIIYH